MEEECPMKGRMSQCAYGMCRHNSYIVDDILQKYKKTDMTTQHEEMLKRFDEKFPRDCGESSIYRFYRLDYPEGDSRSIKSFIESEIKLALAEREKEIVICSGIKLEDGRVLRCHRHGDGMLNAHHNGWKLFNGIEQQGFVTSKGRYVSRKEGRKLQDEAGIKSVDKGGYRGTTLFSEDLY